MSESHRYVRPAASAHEHTAHCDHGHAHAGGSAAPHTHAHHDHHGHAHAHGGSARALLFALLLTLSFSLVEALGGWWSGSLALLGDAGHMLSDSLALGLAAWASRLASRPPSAKHSYGLGRADALAALANAVMMLGIVVAIGLEARVRLLHPEPINALPAAGIAGLGLLVNIGVAFLLSRGESTLNVRAALLHVMGDLLGSVAAIVALGIVHFTGWQAADPVLSLLICGLILSSTLGILRETLHVLLDGVPSFLSLHTIGARMASVPGVASVHDLHVWTYAPRQIALSAHLVITDAARWPAVMLAVRHRIEQEFSITHVTLQPELPGDNRVPLSVLGSRPAPHNK